MKYALGKHNEQSDCHRLQSQCAAGMNFVIHIQYMVSKTKMQAGLFSESERGKPSFLLFRFPVNDNLGDHDSKLCYHQHRVCCLLTQCQEQVQGYGSKATTFQSISRRGPGWVERIH